MVQSIKYNIPGNSHLEYNSVIRLGFRCRCGDFFFFLEFQSFRLEQKKEGR